MTDGLKKWLDELPDRKTRLRIIDRIKRLADGNAGDFKSVGDNVLELRFRFGPGYRVYYTWQNSRLVLLLAGGDKDSQPRDIIRAKALAKEANDGLESYEV
ncbi:type II toxin-antitoxin system RelE/ParE family toxin [Novosphingobium sp. FKTRR1]|uniref:type II toxin-antitoxin system RelE/ParE family toxin n=1 Tax=Novosphingobium sp. FKTRR1 TaxID=2879118 RepID=UPI001CF0A43F|nr:type II toxin-antitoxin system RelE/ParE family toxin [Novosphingobium sp. FKTRR1]